MRASGPAVDCSPGIWKKTKMDKVCAPRLIPELSEGWEHSSWLLSPWTGGKHAAHKCSSLSD